MGMWSLARDRMSRIQAMNHRRALNFAKLAWSYRQAKRRHEARMPMSAMPSTLSIEPTTSCNLRCPECLSGLRAFQRPTGMLNVNHALQWIDDMAPWLMYVNLYLQGEPLLHPQLEEVVRRCHHHGLYSSTSTNAHHLTKERCQALVDSGLSRLILSIDGLTQETYASYRVGGSLEKVLTGTRTLLEAKQARGHGPHVVWQFLVVGPNEHEVPQLLETAANLGVDEVQIKTAQLDQPHDGHPLLTSAPEFRRYDRNPRTSQWTIRNPMNDACWRMWHGTVITWDGRVVPCCFDKDANHVMGNLTTQTMKEIWHDRPYSTFRSNLFANRAGLDMCTNCSEGSHTYA